jgi:tripeptide aminopeptidase
MHQPKIFGEDTSLVDRFLTYVKYDTQSDENSESYPSTAKQLELSKRLKKECEELGIAYHDVSRSGAYVAEY